MLVIRPRSQATQQVLGCESRRLAERTLAVEWSSGSTSNLHVVCSSNTVRLPPDVSSDGIGRKRDTTPGQNHPTALSTSDRVRKAVRARQPTRHVQASLRGTIFFFLYARPCRDLVRAVPTLVELSRVMGRGKKAAAVNHQEPGAMTGVRYIRNKRSQQELWLSSPPPLGSPSQRRADGTSIRCFRSRPTVQPAAETWTPTDGNFFPHAFLTLAVTSNC